MGSGREFEIWGRDSFSLTFSFLSNKFYYLKFYYLFGFTNLKTRLNYRVARSDYRRLGAVAAAARALDDALYHKKKATSILNRNLVSNRSMKEPLVVFVRTRRDNLISIVSWPDSQGIALIIGSTASLDMQSSKKRFLFIQRISQAC